MNTTKTKTAVAIGTMLVLIAGLLVIVGWKRLRSATQTPTPAAKIAATVDRIQEVSAGLPDLQIQAKTLIFTATIQKQIPAASKWCETLNVGGKLWPVTPTNTVFALNAQIAGHAYSRANMPPGDLVVFFESATPGWNLAGGPELLAKRPGGVAVAMADGRAMVVTPDEAAALRWKP